MNITQGELPSGNRFRGMKLEMKRVEDLIPQEHNTKLHPDHQVADIAKSISSSGFCDPITVDAYNNIIDGHGRRLALISLGIEEVPCIVLDMNATVQRAYGIAHNQTTLSSSFDYLKIKQDIDSFGLTSDDLALTGFDRDSMRLISAADDVATNLDAVKEFKEDSSAWKGLVDKVHRFEFEFISEEDQFVWSNFLIRLKQTYPNKETIADRLIAFIEDSDAT